MHMSTNLPLSQFRDCGDETALKILGGNVRRERVARSISQQKLALLTGLNARTDLQDRGRRAQHSTGDYPTT